MKKEIMKIPVTPEPLVSLRISKTPEYLVNTEPNTPVLNRFENFL